MCLGKIFAAKKIDALIIHSCLLLLLRPNGVFGYKTYRTLCAVSCRHIKISRIIQFHIAGFVSFLLQILDDGRITDSQGRTVDFKNTIIILTSNLGSQAILDGITPAGEISEEAKNEVQTLLRRSFRPEFLNRLDEIVFYKPLSKENITGIIDLQIAALNKRLADKQLTCELTPAAKTFVIDAAYDPQFGARPLRRYLQHTVETLLAQRILRGDVLPGQTLVCDVQNGELVITAK